MEPVKDVRQISRIAYGFMASQALFSALELGVFTHLSKTPKTLDQLATDTGVAANRLQTLLAALLSVGLLAKDGDSYANAPACETFLVRGAPSDYGEYLRVVNGHFVYPAWGKMEAGLRGERAFDDKGFYEGMIYESSLDAASFSKAQHDGSLGPAALLAKRIDLTGFDKLLDVGGGSGAFTITLCRKYPALQAIILDFPETMDTAKGYAADAGLSGCIGHVGGNALATDWPGGQDVVLMSYIWSVVGGVDYQTLAQRAHAALNPGGMVIVHDFMAAEDFTGPPIAVWHLLGSMMDNPDAVCLTPAFVTDVLTRAGFSHPDSSELIPGITSAVTARKAQ